MIPRSFIVPAVTKPIAPKVIANVTSLKVNLVKNSWMNQPAANVINIAIHPKVCSIILMKNIHNPVNTMRAPFRYPPFLPSLPHSLTLTLRALKISCQMSSHLFPFSRWQRRFPNPHQHTLMSPLHWILTKVQSFHPNN